MSKEKTKKELTTKEKMFVHYWLNNHFNATKAAIDAKYSKKTAGVIGSENLKKPYIKEYIDSVIGEVIKDQKRALEARLLDLYQVRAFYDPKDVISDSGELIKPLEELGQLSKCIEGIETEEEVITEKLRKPAKVKIKLCNRERAMELLAKYMSMMTEKVDVTHEYKEGHPVANELKKIREGIK